MRHIAKCACWLLHSTDGGAEGKGDWQAASSPLHWCRLHGMMQPSPNSQPCRIRAETKFPEFTDADEGTVLTEVCRVLVQGREDR